MKGRLLGELSPRRKTRERYRRLREQGTAAELDLLEREAAETPNPGDKLYWSDAMLEVDNARRQREEHERLRDAQSRADAGEGFVAYNCDGSIVFVPAARPDEPTLARFPRHDQRRTYVDGSARTPRT